ncbi:hypothetical protein [Microcystis aeruginosa]|uniref:hypothetical protein n=1 Tax=Microcystis aeruginosa TaxID=1126 RepID=UPI0019D60A8F|nr:hypothetical protein [Microcystis aeruginosa]
MKSLLILIALAFCPLKFWQSHPNPPDSRGGNPTETEPVEGEINDAPRTEDNPLLRPDLDSLIENKIAEDVWSQLKGDSSLH